MTRLNDAPSTAGSAPNESKPGARWWKLDIHAHSPASNDFGGLEGKDTEDNKPTFREWVRAYIDAAVDGLVVTDHNTHTGIDQARHALEELRAGDPSVGDLSIFPGVELTVSGGVHVLGIFDPATPADTIAKLISRCQYDGVPGSSTQTANLTVSDAAQEIAKLGGICVPAHADKTAGILTGSQLDLPTLKQANIAAIEISDDENVADGSRHGWVPLLGSDSHHLDTNKCPPGQEAKAPGTHFTWVKSEILNLDGLRLALTDARDSIRRGRLGDENPNETVHGIVSRIIINHDGRTQKFVFNPWMNCLIGGRGVGKSTIVELIRLALGRTDDLRKTALADDLDRFIPGGEPSEKWWDGTTRIEVHYTRGEQHLRVLWSGSKPKSNSIEAWNGTGWEAQAGLTSDRTPIQVFSQKQIYDLARDPQSFLTILDQMEEIDKSRWAEEYSALENRFRQAREELRELLAQTGRADRVRGKLQEVQARLRHLDELRAEPNYQELEAIESKVRLTDAAERDARDVVSKLREQTQALRLLSEAGQEVLEYRPRASNFTDAAGRIEAILSELAAGELSWSQDESRTRWPERIQELNTWLAEHGGSSPRVSPEKVNNDRQYEKQLVAELDKFQDIDEKVAGHQASLDQLLIALQAKRKELYDRRASYVKQLSTGPDARTRVRVYHQAGIDNVGDELRKLLKRPDSFDAAFAQDGIAAPLFEAERKAPNFAAEVIPSLRGELRDLIRRGPDSTIAKRTRIDARFYKRNEGDVFDIETSILLWHPEDFVTVEYKPDGSGNFTAVDKGSPGQKTAALLAIILQMGTEPLLLDQPEDDLENKLIKHLAVETLKQIKKSRQLIVSTHNANIVVTTAAEQVLVIQHGDHIPTLEASGTLQDAAVRSNVCLILEGGEDAITTRYRRLVEHSL